MSNQTQRQPRPNGNRVAPREPKPKENRDPNNLNDHVQCNFYCVLGEPERGPKSFDCIWEFSELMFDCCKNCWYKLFGLFCGCCIAIGWALEFVPILFTHIWICTPFKQCFHIVCGVWARSCCFLLARCMIAPYTKACAQIFSHCSYGVTTRPETPSLFPPRQKKKPVPPKPVEKKPEPVVQEKKNTAPVVVAGGFDNYDKEKIAKSVRRQMMLY